MFVRGLWAAWVGLLGAIGVAVPAEAGMFRFQDETGIVYYTNAPSDPRYRRLPSWRDPVAPSQPAPPARRLARFANAIRTATDRYRVDRRLVEAVIVVESGGNPRAVSRKGAMGLMQLMPERSAALGVRNPFDPVQNVDGGVRHLRDLLRRFEGNVTLALAAYNAGEEAVRSHDGVPPYPETQEYVRKVQALYDGREGQASRRGQAPQKIYRYVAADGTITYTNLPVQSVVPHKRRF